MRISHSWLLVSNRTLPLLTAKLTAKYRVVPATTFVVHELYFDNTFRNLADLKLLQHYFENYHVLQYVMKL